MRHCVFLLTVFLASARAAQADFSVAGNTVTYTTGNITYIWTPSPRVGTVQATVAGQSLVTTPSLTLAGSPSAGAGTLAQTAAGVHYTVPFGNTGSLDFYGTLEGSALTIRVSGSLKAVDVNVGTWGGVSGPSTGTLIVTPYLGAEVKYYSSQNMFAAAYLDWMVSQASVLTNPCNAAHYSTGNVPVEEKYVFIASDNYENCLPVIPNLASSQRQLVGEKLVCDVWPARTSAGTYAASFAQIEATMQSLASYGLSDVVVLDHVWQNQGYDNGLPGVAPANAGLGGDVALQSAINTAKRLGYIYCLHENYRDYYPNYSGYADSDIALDINGNKILAWFNTNANVQSFMEKPTRRLALCQLQGICQLYGTNGSYLDTHSAAPPPDGVDFDPTVPGAGTFQAVNASRKQLWSFQRSASGGPVFGEGASHWQYAGLLDGVEAHVNAHPSLPSHSGTVIPLNVGFDLLRLHPLMISHGMGYLDGWSHSAAPLPSMDLQDQYRMQSLIFGHCGFLNNSLWYVPGLAFREHHQITPVTSRHASATVSTIEYQVAGSWVDSSAAAKANSFDQVRVTWDNGLVMAANNVASPLSDAGFNLPQFGWYAVGAGVTAYTTGVSSASSTGKVDFAQTSSTLFANARNPTEWQSAITISLTDSPAPPRRGPPPRAIKVPKRTTSSTPPPTTPVETTTNGPPPTASPAPTTTTSALSAEAPASTTASGPPPKAATPTAAPPQSLDSSPPTLAAALALSVTQPQAATAAGTAGIDFGPVVTDGAIFVKQTSTGWNLKVFPRSRNFSLSFLKTAYAMPTAVNATGKAAVTPVDNDLYWTLPLNGAAEYTWP